MSKVSDASPKPSSFRKFFVRGLGVLLPTILTIYILVVIFQFVESKIAAPINRGVQEAILSFTDWPFVSEEELIEARSTLNPEQRAKFQGANDKDEWLLRHTRRQSIVGFWNSISIAGLKVLNLIGLLIAAILIYAVGRILGSYLGRGLYRRVEIGLRRVPVFKQVYPYVKQVTDFVVGDEREKLQFNQVVAVEYPRKGIWSVGLMTGNTMRAIQDEIGKDSMTIFIPSSPTPFTGYVITVPKADAVALPISIDEALRFVVSGGVIVPEHQVIEETGPGQEVPVKTISVDRPSS